MTHPLLLRCLSENPYGIFMWLYVTSRGYMPQSVVIRLIVLLMRQHLTTKNPEVVMCPRPWLYVPYRGYTWLYTAYVSKRCHNFQTVVLSGYMIKTVVIYPSSWLYDLLF